MRELVISKLVQTRSGQTAVAGADQARRTHISHAPSRSRPGEDGVQSLARAYPTPGPDHVRCLEGQVLGSSQAPVLFVEVPPADSIDDRTSPLEVDPSGIRSCDETRASFRARADRLRSEGFAIYGHALDLGAGRGKVRR